MTSFAPVDVKLALMRWLRDNLGVPVVSTRPDDAQAPARFVRVINTGGTGRHDRVLQTGQVTIDAYGKSPQDAMSLALEVQKVLYAAVASPQSPVSVVSGNNPSDFPDPDTAQARATCTYQITIRPQTISLAKEEI